MIMPFLLMLLMNYTEVDHGHYTGWI
jgi:putative transposase